MNMPHANIQGNERVVTVFKVCSTSSDPNEDGQWSQGLVSAVSNYCILYVELYRKIMMTLLPINKLFLGTFGSDSCEFIM
jgi:hypothetical protein